MVIETSIGNYLQNLRKERKISLRAVADHIGIDVSMLSKIEHGERQIQAYQLSRIAEFFQLDFRQLQIEFLIQRIHLEYGDQPYLKESLERYLEAISKLSYGVKQDSLAPSIVMKSVT